MKKTAFLLCLGLLFLLTLGLAACGGADTTAPAPDAGSSSRPQSENPDNTGDPTGSSGEDSTSRSPSESSESPAESSQPTTQSAPLVYDRYDPAVYALFPWEGEIVYNESLMFVGEDDIGTLLYTPTEILSVRSSDLTVEYKEGIDYVVENGAIRRTSGSSIPYMEITEYYPAQPHPSGSFASRIPEHPYLRWGEGDTFTRYQLAVTYRHEGTWEGYIPEGQGSKLPKTLAKLKNGEETTLLFFGDSITEGYNTSRFIGQAPYADTWASLATQAIAAHFGNDKVTCINTAVAGKDSTWGRQTYRENVVAYAPDLVVLAFGMNDAGLTPQLHVNNMKTLIRNLQRELPDTEIVVVSPMLPNEEAAGFWGNQWMFENEYLTSLVRTYPTVPVVRMTTLHKELLLKKDYYDLTGNNINHPNDFLARFYACALIATVIGE